MPKVGDTVGHYLITGTIASGAMGTVFRARDERDNRDYALKLLDPAYSRDFIFRAGFER
jgi:serine/threonine protein kinase